jgi:hypothetical protein
VVTVISQQAFFLPDNEISDVKVSIPMAMYMVIARIGY